MLRLFLMANAAHNAPKLEIGKLSAEEAERLASNFRPIWELDDAPFAQGGALSAADVDALAAGAGVTPSIRGTEQLHDNQQGGTFEIKTQITPPPRVPAPDEPKVEIAVEAVEPEPEPAPRKQTPTIPPARRPYSPPQPPPAPIRMAREPGASGDFMPVKKSSTPIVLVAVGAVALIGIIIGVHAAMSGGSKSSTATTATAEPTHETTAAIPPPPPDTAAAAQTQATTQQTAAPAPPPPATQEAHEAETVTQPAPDLEAPTHHATTPTHATHAAIAPTHVAHTHSHGGGHSTIVRDNPF